MREETVFIAFDGKRFDDKDECSRYERIARLREVENDIRIRSWDGKLLEFNEDLRLESINYIIVKSPAAMKRIDVAFENNGIISPYPPDQDGVYPAALIGVPMYYSKKNDGWCNALDTIQEAKELKTIFEIS